jgi:protein XRP2
VDRCNNCKFYIGPITASLFIRNCTGCEITVACSQFRSRDLNQSTVYLYSPNDPIIESSTDLTFGPWNLKYTNLGAQSETAKIIGEFRDDEGTMMMKVNKWNQIFDFTTKPDGQKNYKFVTASKFKV